MGTRAYGISASDVPDVVSGACTQPKSVDSLREISKEEPWRDSLANAQRIVHYAQHPTD